MSSMYDSKEVEALLAAVRDNPDDDTPRLVLADWIQENIQDSDTLQALYRGGAKRWLEELAETYGGEAEWEDEEEDDDGNTVVVTRTHDEYTWLDYEYILTEGRRCLLGEEAQWVGANFNCGNIQGLADFLNEETNAQMLWTCLEVMTGIRADNARGKAWFSCAC